MVKRHTFSKADRIRTSSEFRTLSKYGKRCYSELFIVISRKNQLSRSRLGITVSKKVGKAVTRNKIKRITRDYFRLNRNRLSSGMDINIIARASSGTADGITIRKHLQRCFNKVSGHDMP